MKTETRSVKVMTINGKPVMDGVSEKTIVILAEDVAKAKTHSASACAAAVAIRRQFKLKGARVYLKRTYMEQENVWVRYITPASLRAEIISFDRGYDKWKGGTFILRPPPPSQQIGSPHHNKPKPKVDADSSKKRRVKQHKVEGVRRHARGNLD